MRQGTRTWGRGLWQALDSKASAAHHICVELHADGAHAMHASQWHTKASTHGCRLASMRARHSRTLVRRSCTCKYSGSASGAASLWCKCVCEHRGTYTGADLRVSGWARCSICCASRAKAGLSGGRAEGTRKRDVYAIMSLLRAPCVGEEGVGRVRRAQGACQGTGVS